MNLLFIIISLKVHSQNNLDFQYYSSLICFLFQAFGLCSPSAVRNDVRVKRLLSDPDDPRFEH